jgi:hypothetical protein
MGDNLISASYLSSQSIRAREIKRYTDNRYSLRFFLGVVRCLQQYDYGGSLFPYLKILGDVVGNKGYVLEALGASYGVESSGWSVMARIVATTEVHRK